MKSKFALATIMALAGGVVGTTTNSQSVDRIDATYTRNQRSRDDKHVGNSLRTARLKGPDGRFLNQRQKRKRERQTNIRRRTQLCL